MNSSLEIINEGSYKSNSLEKHYGREGQFRETFVTQNELMVDELHTSMDYNRLPHFSSNAVYQTTWPVI